MRVKKALRLFSGRTFETVLGVTAASLLVFSAVASLIIAPPDALQGDVQRLMYVHVPAAWLAYLAFLVVFVASVGYLLKKDLAWDRVAHASAEEGPCAYGSTGRACYAIRMEATRGSSAR